MNGVNHDDAVASLNVIVLDLSHAMADLLASTILRRTGAIGGRAT